MTNDVTIYQDIGSKPDEFSPQAMRDFLRQSGCRPVAIRLNSQGGSVVDGMAIYSLLKAYPGRKTVYVDGMALSIASIVAMAGDEIYMPDNAWLMMHNPHNEADGDGDDLRAMAGLLDGMRDQMADIYASRSGQPVAEVKRLMAEETWFTGQQAVEAGFCDCTSATLAAAATYDASRFRNAPEQSTAPTVSASELFFDKVGHVMDEEGISRAEAVRRVSIAQPHLAEAYRIEFNGERRDHEEGKHKAAARARNRRNPH